MNPNWLHVAVVVGLLGGAVNTVGIVASALDLAEFFPPGERDWRFYVHWGCSHLLNAGILGVAVLDWNALGLPRPVLAAGAVGLVGGYAVAIEGGRDLGFDETLGLEGELQVEGLYRYSRNPQYVGYLAATAGAALVVASPWALPLLAIYALWWLLLPFAEEPWLREQYGEAYERYRERVPRYVGRRSFRPYRGADDRGRAGPGGQADPSGRDDRTGRADPGGQADPSGRGAPDGRTDSGSRTDPDGRNDPGSPADPGSRNDRDGVEV